MDDKQEQFFLVLDGPSCGGKSSVADVIQSRLPGVFNARLDKIKWLISDYASKRYDTVLEEMMFAMTEATLKHDLSVVWEGSGRLLRSLKQLAAKQNVPIVFANISAPKDVLHSRFQERIEAKAQGARVANTDVSRFERVRQLYEETKVDTPLEFDSSTQSPAETADDIVD